MTVVLRLLILLYNGGVINCLMPLFGVKYTGEILNGQQLSIIQCTSGDIDPHYNYTIVYSRSGVAKSTGRIAIQFISHC